MPCSLSKTTQPCVHYHSAPPSLRMSLPECRTGVRGALALYRRPRVQSHLRSALPCGLPLNGAVGRPQALFGLHRTQR